MKKLSALLVLFCLVGIRTMAEDWERIARETDEPGFAMRISELTPGGQGEMLGLQNGDLVYRIGDRAMRGVLYGRRDQPETMLFCRPGGRMSEVTVQPGKLGLWYSAVFRPQLDYLRGKIGSRDERWDRAVVDALAELEASPDSAASLWQRAKALGYPDDELDAFVRAYCAWKGGGRAPLRETMAKIEERHDTVPGLYAAMLEDMAYCSGATDVLRHLHGLDPASSSVSDSLMTAWSAFDSSPLPAGAPLQMALAKRGRDLRRELVASNDETRNTPDNLRKLPRWNVEPGRYVRCGFRLPEDVVDFHYSISFEVLVREHDEKFANEVRAGAFIGREDGGRLGDRRIAQLGTQSQRGGETIVWALGGYDSMRREYRQFDAVIPVSAEGDAAPAEFRIDIVRLGREAAAYCDGFAYCRLPIDPDAPTAELEFFASGVEVRLKRFEVWSLKPD